MPINSQNYYIYRITREWTLRFKNFVFNLINLYKNSELTQLQNILASFSYLTYITDKSTCEVLMVIAYKLDFSSMPNASYEVYRISP